MEFLWLWHPFFAMLGLSEPTFSGTNRYSIDDALCCAFVLFVSGSVLLRGLRAAMRQEINETGSGLNATAFQEHSNTATMADPGG